jgi:uncharacterized protein YecT (DUF1311 family)
MRVSFWLVLILPLVGTTKSFAQTCNDAANQMQMNECAETAFKNADDELNSVYGILYGVLRLTKLQRSSSWRHRKRGCVFAMPSVRSYHRRAAAAAYIR